MTHRRMCSVLGGLALATSVIAQQAFAEGVTLTIACGAIGVELEQCKIGAQAWAKATGNSVEFLTLPQPSNERLALIQQLLAAQSTDVDVFALDVVWPGLLADQLVDLSAAVPADVLAAHNQEIVENNTVDGRLVALPWFVDAGLLYYRTDLLDQANLEVPKTWVDLEAAAKTIMEAQVAAGKTDFSGYVWQGRAYEGLTCAALELIHSFGGGSIIENGKVTVNNPRAAEAITMAASWIGGISPQGVLNYNEEDARGVFQSGNAAFMRNWPYAWKLLNSDDSAVRGRVGVTVLPKTENGQHSATLGGRQIGVSVFSKHQKEAIDLILYLVSKEEQRRRALEAGYNPTIVALYNDPALVEANPIIPQLAQIFGYVVARPSRETGEKYPEVSNAFWNAVHSVLSGKAKAEPALADFEGRIARLLR